MHMVSILQ